MFIWGAMFGGLFAGVGLVLCCGCVAVCYGRLLWWGGDLLVVLR